jgi:predicted RND superfamily exporter protein
VSIGSSSVANQSMLGELSTSQGQTALIIIIAIAAILLLMWRRHEA